MKKIAFLLLSQLILLDVLQAQKEKDEDEEKKGFKKENLFTGGSATVSFFSGTTILGLSPYFGYRIANWVDAGVVFNVNYTGVRDYKEFDDKLKQTTFGGGAFTRLYPLNFIFLQCQYEHNFIKQKYTPSTNFYLPYTEKVDAGSLLVGGGYTQGRQPGSNTFYYLAVLFDVMKDVNSPYVDRVYNPSTGEVSVRTAPIIRAGINIGLFEKRYNR